MLSECCENKLEIYGEKNEITKFINENCNNEIIDFRKCCNDNSLSNDDYALSNNDNSLSYNFAYFDSDECSLRFQLWGTLYNLNEVIKIGLGKYFSSQIYYNKAIFKFATISFPPRIWLNKVGCKYYNLTFKLWYSQHRHYPLATIVPNMSRLKSSGILGFCRGECSGIIFGLPGEYYDNHCQWCGKVVKIFRNKLNTCVYCKMFAYNIISKHVLRYKVNKVREKIALSRIGRNLIVNMYLVKKVYIPRLNLEEPPFRGDR